MKKRIAATALTLSMLMNQAFETAVFASDGTNGYGHEITYKPVTQLYTGGEAVKFFDSGVSEWGTLSDKITRNEAESIKWLQSNNYLLNHFGRVMPADKLKGCINSKGEWQTQLKGPTNVKVWYAAVDFDALAEKEGRADGNISNMYDKGDLQYFFSWKVKTVQTRWGIGGKSNDIGQTYAFGQLTSSSGGGWKKYNTLGDGPNLGDFSAWKPAETFSSISFIARSDKDSRVDSYLSGAMLVGRDAKGPKIDSVKVTSDKKGENELENGVINLNNVDKLNDRTVYFQVTWDEPVLFKNLSQKDLSKLTLLVDTIGIDGTSGTMAEAHFLEFAPSKTDGKPVMVFEYKIADPYTDSSAEAQERGYFYRFSKVTVSEKENKAFWNNIYDISGNKFGTDSNGQQPAAKVVTPISGTPYVDLNLFSVKNIRLTTQKNTDNAFVDAGDLLGITLELNKAPSEKTRVWDLPEITLNLKDGSTNVKIAPNDRGIRKKFYYSGKWTDTGYFYDKNGRMMPVVLDRENKSITYYTQVCDEQMDGDSVKVTAITAREKGVFDDSGYTLPDYALDSDGMLYPKDIPPVAEQSISKYAVSPDKKYKVDFSAPDTDISIEDRQNGLILIKASVTDSSVEGCEAAFTVKTDGSVGEEGIAYRAAASEDSLNGEWKLAAPGAATVSFSAPIVPGIGGGMAYGFIQLPQKSEASKLEISVTAADEAGNSSTSKETFTAPEWNGFDTLAPTVSAAVKGENVIVEISDLDDIEYMYGFSDDADTEPAYETQSGKSGIIKSPDIPYDGIIHKKVVWIKAQDSGKNVSEPVKLPIKYDRTYTKITVDADTDKEYGKNEYPSCEAVIENVKSYWYMWAEIPANTSDTAAYITENAADDMRQRAEELYQYMEVNDIDPDTPESNNNITETIRLSAYSMAASVNSADETFGENIHPDDAKRPLMLIIGADKDDGSTLVKTVEFNTYYNLPEITVRQNRFSTNDAAGRRIDYIRNDKATGLISADDECDNPLNTPHLFGFAQAELYIAADPITGLDRVDMQNSTISFEKVLYGGKNIGGEVKSRTKVNEWSFEDINLQKLSGGTFAEFERGAGKMNGELAGGKFSPVYGAVVDIDTKALYNNYFEYDEDGNCYAVRYEFVSNIVGTNGSKRDAEPISYFSFCNTPAGYPDSTAYDGWGGISEYQSFAQYEKKNIEAVFDEKGKDVTADIPVYTFSTDYVQKQYVRFGAPAASDADFAYYGASRINSENNAGMTVRIGTAPNKLSEPLAFTADGYKVLSEPYYIGDLISGHEDGFLEITLYYQFEHPERGVTSPVYVLKLRQDNISPVFDISISETENLTNEVLVKINGVCDIQTDNNGNTFVDTPKERLEAEASCEAWRIATSHDNLDDIDEEDIMYMWYDGEEYSAYIRVFPDENGIYHFTSNGYFDFFALDGARNIVTSLLINGELVNVREEGDDFTRYHIENVTSELPQFTEKPIITANKDEGSFTISAKTDAENVYLKFDKAYEELLSGEFFGDGRYELKNVPGVFSESSENGNISAKIYAKYSDTVSLSDVTLVIADKYGNEAEYKHSMEQPLFGRKAEITNARNENGYPVYNGSTPLDFSVPVKTDGSEYSQTHSNLPIYEDGITAVTFTDLFGQSYSENIYADIYGEAFRHSLIFTADAKVITPDTPVSGDVTVTIDISKNKNLSAEGGKTKFVLSENGILTYSLTNSKLTETKKFSVPVTNIDKTPPEAIVSVNIDSDTDSASGKTYIYSVTYTVEGFSEENVSMLPTGEEVNSITFDKNSESKEYTFRFSDRAGNENIYKADVSDIEFSERKDVLITDYRLIYRITDENGLTILANCSSGETPDIGIINKAVSAEIKALNKNGEIVSSTVRKDGDLPEGTKLYEKGNLVTFTGESSADRIADIELAGAANTLKAQVILPANTIDITAPAASVFYAPDGNNVKAYLQTDDTDWDKVYVIGTKDDGTAFELKSDERGYYTELDTNGSGRFVITDKAGNIGNAAIAVFSIDKEPPAVESEGWQSLREASTEEEIARLLSEPTNNSIKLFLKFNEQIKGAEVKAFESDNEKKELVPTSEYVTAAANGSTLTVEFKQNCRAKLVVYDLRNNALTLWRPEDGPITVIDKEIPKPAPGYPKETFENNTVTIEYVFADGEEVMLLSDDKGGYKNKHTIKFSENGQQILSFADKAGNVFTDYPLISVIDDLAPRIKISSDYVGDGRDLSLKDSYKAGNMYTSRNVRILLNVTDETSDGIVVEAKTKAGVPIEVKSGNISADGKDYNYYVVVSENGAYSISAKDKWGHENAVETRVSVIDKTGPAITIKDGKTLVFKTGTDENAVRERILADVSAADSQSGANNPMGSVLGEVSDGVTAEVDLSGVELGKEGTYNAKIVASDRLGNKTEKLRTVTVKNDIYAFEIGSMTLYANDIMTAPVGTIRLNNPTDTAKYYYSKGYKTAAQMKYAKPFDAKLGFEAMEKGYYTVMAAENNRKMYLLYVYVN